MDVPPDSTANGARPTSPLRLLVIGAGSRGNSYATAVGTRQDAIIASIAEPIASKRERFGKKHIWTDGRRRDDQSFETWQDYVHYEHERRKKAAAGQSTLPGFDGAFICTLDDTHVEIVEALAPLGLHLLCEKPLATSLTDCQRIDRALKQAREAGARAVFSTGHVLRYSPHNMLLKDLIETKAIGDVLSIEHTEPVGFWHFAHSYVRYVADRDMTLGANGIHQGELEERVCDSPISPDQVMPRYRLHTLANGR